MRKISVHPSKLVKERSTASPRQSGHVSIFPCTQYFQLSVITLLQFVFERTARRQENNWPAIVFVCTEQVGLTLIGDTMRVEFTAHLQLVNTFIVRGTVDRFRLVAHFSQEAQLNSRISSASTAAHSLSSPWALIATLISEVVDQKRLRLTRKVGFRILQHFDPLQSGLVLPTIYGRIHKDHKPIFECDN